MHRHSSSPYNERTVTYGVYESACNNHRDFFEPLPLYSSSKRVGVRCSRRERRTGSEGAIGFGFAGAGTALGFVSGAASGGAVARATGRVAPTAGERGGCAGTVGTAWAVNAATEGA